MQHNGNFKTVDAIQTPEQINLSIKGFYDRIVYFKNVTPSNDGKNLQTQNLLTQSDKICQITNFQNPFTTARAQR
jgi:hypothetical protein